MLVLTDPETGCSTSIITPPERVAEAPGARKVPVEVNLLCVASVGHSKSLLLAMGPSSKNVALSGKVSEVVFCEKVSS
jgi:hypothetical protein